MSYAQFFVNITMNIYYMVLMAWSMAYLFYSFKTPLPWQVEANQEGENSAETVFNPDFFNKEILQKSKSINEPGGLVPIVTFCLLLSYILLYFAVFKGIESSGKVAYFTAPFPYILLLILLFRALTLDGATEGLKFLFVPKWEKLAKF